MKTEFQIVEEFVRRVCERAEHNMEITHKLEGAHHAAMMFELEQMRTTTAPDQASRCRYCDEPIWDRLSGLCWYHQNNPPGR